MKNNNQQCPNCSKMIETDLAVCPFCGSMTHFEPTRKRSGTVLANVSMVSGALGCITLVVNVLISVLSGPVGSIDALRFSWLYLVPALLAVLAGMVALVLPKAHRTPNRRRAVIGIVLGIVLLLWVVFWVVVIAPWLAMPAYGA